MISGESFFVEHTEAKEPFNNYVTLRGGVEKLRDALRSVVKVALLKSDTKGGGVVEKSPKKRYVIVERALSQTVMGGMLGL